MAVAAQPLMGPLSQGGSSYFPAELFHVDSSSCGDDWGDNLGPYVAGQVMTGG